MHSSYNECLLYASYFARAWGYSSDKDGEGFCPQKIDASVLNLHKQILCMYNKIIKGISSVVSMWNVSFCQVLC